MVYNQPKKWLLPYMRIILLFLLLFPITLFGQNKPLDADKKALVESISRHSEKLIALSDQIWAHAETAMEEYKSSALLADYAEAQGFRVKRGVAGIPTAFVAEYGSGKPIIGILGEYDALPGISQKATATKEPLKTGAAGHGCGHNMFGPGSLGAAIAIKEMMAAGKIKGTIRFYGTPAEEAVGGKIYMAREGLFNDLDVCLDWHPDSEIVANAQSSQAMNDYLIEFHGKAAHAAFDPWNGRSATDGMELFLAGINMLREHIQPTTRIHYVIQSGGDVPNVVPEFARVWLWVRDSKREVVSEVSERVKAIAQGAGLMAGVKAEVKLQSGMYELLVNRRGAEVLQRNLELLGPIVYTEAEQNFAKEIQRNTETKESGLNGSIRPLRATELHPVGGSTDVGDVSWIVPEITLLATTAPTEAPWHSWAVVACGGMSIGHKGMLYASKALALTMLDLYKNQTYINEIQSEFKINKGNHVYKANIPDGPPPVKTDK